MGFLSGAAQREKEVVRAGAATVSVLTPTHTVPGPVGAMQGKLPLQCPRHPRSLSWAAALPTRFICYPLPLALHALKNQGNLSSVGDSPVFFAVLVEVGDVLM